MDMEGLSAICAGLGVVDEDRDGNRIGYSKGEYCLDNLKDLLRFLRRDDPQNRDVFKLVCKWNTVSKDLIPIIEHSQDDRNLVLNAVKVLVFLTMPIEPSSSDISQQIEYLWGLKYSITCSDIVAVIVSLLESPLENLERDELTEDDWKLVQLILTLFRNILAIQELSLQQKSGGNASHFLALRDRFLELLFRENVMDLIIVITQHFGGYLRQENLLLLEIFHYIFLGQEPELVAKSHLKGTEAGEGSKASINILKSIMEEEAEKRRLSRSRNLGRHSHFVGTFTRLTMDGSKEVFNGKPASVSRETLIKQHKISRGPAKKIAWNHGRLPPSKDEILELLHDFVNHFLSGGYNGLMQSLREDIEKEHPSIQKSDIIIFFQVAQFVIAFQYYKFGTSKPKTGVDASEPLDDMHSDNTLFEGDVCGPIAASMNDSMFQLVFSNWRETFEGLKETQNFKFLSAAGSLMKNMICMLDLVLKVLPEDSRESQTARILLYKLFYDQTDQGLTQFLLHLLKSFDTHKQAKSDMEDLIEMICRILHLMENLQARGTLRVSKKTRRRKNKKAPVEKEAKSDFVGEQSSIPNKIDSSTNDKPAEMDNAPKDTENTSSNEKEETMTTSHADKLEGSVLETETNHDSVQETNHKSSGDAIANDNLYGTGDSSGDEQVAATTEVDFNVSTLVSSFGNNNIIQKICWLLKFYKSNSTSTNEYIIGMLQRISNDLDLSAMLYQLSLLTLFYDILAQQKSCPCKEYANIVDFLTSLVRKMLKKMKSQPLLFVEALFLKTRRECHYIDAEYLLHELGHLKKLTNNWGKDSGAQDIGSSQDKEWTRVSIADALGEDEADVEIIHDLGNEEANIREVKRSTFSISGGELNGQEIHRKGKKSTVNEPGKVAKLKKRIALGSDLDEKIRDLYEKFKDSPDCSRLIAEDLDLDGKVLPLQVSKKLKQLGLECRRKRLRHVDSTKAFDSNTLDGEERRSTNQRKKVRTFIADQEATIRALYEQFKDHKRCSFMIANAMDGVNKFTVSQVSRKLKQLGLYIPRQKRTQAKKHLIRDGDINGISTEKENDTDDETLSSRVNRGKSIASDKLFSQDAQENSSAERFSEDDSDNETIASVAKKRKGPLSKLKGVKLTEISSKAIIDDGSENAYFSEDDSDNEILASVVKKRKGPLSESKGVKLAEISSKAITDDGSENAYFSEVDSDNEILASVVKKRKGPLSKSKGVKLIEIPSKAMADDGLENAAEESVSVRDVREQSSSEPRMDDTREAGESLIGSPKPLDGTPIKSLYGSPRADVDHENVDLEDSEDEVAFSEEPPTSVVNRRRMVLDFEDDY